jgi:hypothetical protein
MTTVPSRLQILQGELEMWPYVISTDVTDESRYAGAWLGHPLVRQPFIFSLIGRDHLRVGTGLRSKLGSIITHLHFTHHSGMPVWDLQVVQTHPDGLAQLRQRTVELLDGSSPFARRARRILPHILPEPDSYLEQFIGVQGWIARAERFEYSTAADDGSSMPEEFNSVAGFMQYCADTFPERVEEVGLLRWPGRVARLATRRFREGKGFGWFAADRTAPA